MICWLVERDEEVVDKRFEGRGKYGMAIDKKETEKERGAWGHGFCSGGFT